MYWLGQGIGVIGFIISAISFMQKDDRKMKNILGVSSVLVAVAYYMIGAMTGAGAIMVSAVRNFVAAQGFKSKLVYPFFMIVCLVVGYYTYQTPFDFLSIAGALCATTALFKFDGIPMRLLMIVSCSLWFTYDVISTAIGPMMMEFFNVVACIYAIQCLRAQKSTS